MKQLKKCKICQKAKAIDSFSTNGISVLSDGTKKIYRKSICKLCNASKMKSRRRTNKRHYLLSQWFHMEKRCKNRKKYAGFEYPDAESYVAWAIKRDDFNRLFLEWVSSGYKIQESPSIDRINNSLGYTFDNMQFLKFKENSIKDRSKPVAMSFCGDVYEFESRSSAISASKLSTKSFYKLLSKEKDQIKGWSII